MTYDEYLKQKESIEEQIGSLKAKIRYIERDFIEKECPVRVGWAIEANGLRLKIEYISPSAAPGSEIMWRLRGKVLTKQGNLSKKHTGYGELYITSKSHYAIISK